MLAGYCVCVCGGGEGRPGVGWPYGFDFHFILIAGGMFCRGWGGSWGGVAGRGGFDICSCIGFGRDCRTVHQPLRFPNILIFTFPSI